MLLKTVTRTQGNNRALKDGTVRARTCELEFIEVEPLIDAFRRMVRGLEFDVCEMALTTYITARAHGKRMMGLPIFLMRAFHHGAISYNVKSGIRTPRDLEGRRVGVNRGYTVTTGLWARTVLANQYRVDLSKITWVLSGDEHVAEYRPPANVVPLEKGKKMGEMLKSCGYEFSIEETHHVTKVDSPSGTALTLASVIEAATGLKNVPIKSHREGDATGLHVLEAKGKADKLVLTHDAHSRRGFAEGAVRAAEWLATHRGCYDFKDIYSQM